MGRTHATAHRDIESKQLALLDNRDEGQAVGINVDIVRWRHRDGDLELPRQVSLAIDRLDLFLARFDFLTIEPDLVIRARLRGEMVRNPLRDLEHLGVNLGKVRVRVAHDVAVHITAGGDGVHRGLVDLFDRALEVALDDTVKLKGLTRGELDGAIGKLRRHAVGLKPLRRRGNTARHADADHEGVSLVELVLAAVGTQVAIVLLISAVEFQQLLIILGHRTGRHVRKPLGNRAAEVIAARLDVFVRGKFLFFGHKNFRCSVVGLLWRINTHRAGSVSIS